MDVSRPYSAVAPTREGDALVALARSSGPMTGRQVARLVERGSQPAINRALDRLVSRGLVLRESAGRAYLYRLNREHVAFPAVEAMESMKHLLLERLRTTLAQWAQSAGGGAPVHCSMFGSAARGDGDGQSDIDLFLVRPDAAAAEDPGWRDRVDDLCAAVASWTGNQASIIEVAGAQCRGLRASTPAVVAEIERDGIILAGPPLADLLA